MNSNRLAPSPSHPPLDSIAVDKRNQPKISLEQPRRPSDGPEPVARQPVADQRGVSNDTHAHRFRGDAPLPAQACEGGRVAPKLTGSQQVRIGRQRQEFLRELLERRHLVAEPSGPRLPARRIHQVRVQRSALRMDCGHRGPPSVRGDWMGALARAAPRPSAGACWPDSAASPHSAASRNSTAGLTYLTISTIPNQSITPAGLCSLRHGVPHGGRRVQRPAPAASQRPPTPDAFSDLRARRIAEATHARRVQRPPRPPHRRGHPRPTRSATPAPAASQRPPTPDAFSDPRARRIAEATHARRRCIRIGSSSSSGFTHEWVRCREWTKSR